MLKLSRLLQNRAIVNSLGQPTPEFSRLWNDTMQAIEDAENAQAEVDAALQAQQDQITATQADILAAQTAQASQQQQILRSLRAISHADGLFVTSAADGATAKIDITAHTRNYLDQVVSVNAGTITGLLYAMTYSVYYDDPGRTGGAVTYVATDIPANSVTSATNPNRQFVGAVVTPATSGSPPTDGEGTTPPGYPSGGFYPYETP